METIGRTKFLDLQKFQNWIIVNRNEFQEKIFSMFETDKALFPEQFSYNSYYQDEQCVSLKSCIDNIYGNENSWELFGWSEENINKKYFLEKSSWIKLLKYEEYLHQTENPYGYNLLATNDTFSVIQYGAIKNMLIIPTQFLDIQLFKDYSKKSLQEIADTGAESNKETLLPSLPKDKSLYDLKREQEEKENYIKDVQDELKRLEKEKIEELERIKLELEKQYRKKMEVLEQKRNELNLKVQQMQTEIFMIESEIYSIRCFFGETVSFIKIRSGNKAKINSPIILYQKMRFLDEELARMVAIYDFDGNDYKYFEELLKYREDVAETFCPNDKCISFFKISKDNKTFVTNEKNSNLLETTRVFRGHQIGIIIRNGDNHYVGWTDENKVTINDDNIFLRPEERHESIESNDELYELTRKSLTKAMSNAEQIVSRYFIFSIVQGILQNRDMLKLPEDIKISVFHPDNKYLIFSMADEWLEDNTYGVFADIMERCNNQKIRKGDKILTVQHIQRESDYKYRPYYNERGIGDRNRTHDVYTQNNTIYDVNVVEEKINQKYTTYDIYVSLHKSFSRGNARANFFLYNDEYINLTFLNSVWLLYAINNKKIGKWYIGGKEVNYAYSIRYLNKALEYIRKRETEELNIISKYVSITLLPEEWPVLLSEWKMKYDVHKITDYQAKRFVKQIFVASKN